MKPTLALLTALLSLAPGDLAPLIEMEGDPDAPENPLPEHYVTALAVATHQDGIDNDYDFEEPARAII